MKGMAPVRTVAVASGKGGVGKTNLVANLGIALKKMGREVLILDADLGLGGVDILLRLAHRYDIRHVIDGRKRLDEVIVEGPHGIKVLPAASGAQELTNLDEFQRMRLLEEFDSYEGDIDILLIDTPAGISANVAFFCAASQEIVIVTSPEPAALSAAHALIKVLSTRYQEKDFGVLVNSARGPVDAMDAYRKLSGAAGGCLNASLDYLGFIPYDDSVRDAVMGQKAFVDAFPHGPASRKVIEMAARLLEAPPEYAKGTLQFFFGNLFSATAGAR